MEYFLKGTHSIDCQVEHNLKFHTYELSFVMTFPTSSSVFQLNFKTKRNYY